MYVPPAFAEDRPALLGGLIRANPLGLLITQAVGRQDDGDQDDGGPIANLIPFLWQPESCGTRGLLCAHLARANPQLAALRAGAPVLVVFQGPHSYVSPSLYASKAVDGKVVPTWNYLMVQARGRARVVTDAPWMRAQLDALTDQQEAGRPDPWAVADAPQPFLAAQMRGILGVEITVTALSGKWKASQNRSADDRASVALGLAGHPMADIVAAPGAARD